VESAGEGGVVNTELEIVERAENVKCGVGFGEAVAKLLRLLPTLTREGCKFGMVVTEAVGGPSKGVKAIRVEVALAEREFVRKIGVAFVREDNGGLAAVDLARIGGEDAGNAADSRSEVDTIPAVQRERGALHKGKHFSGARGGGNG
jgi:hypothetical protein